MLKYTRHALPFLSLLAALFLGCGSLSDPTLAGGSGAGNPGGGTTGSVAVSISVHFVPTLLKTTSDADSSLDSSRSITTTDKDNLPITITSITLKNLDLHFTVDSSRKPAALLSGIKHAPPQLQADSNSIFVSWPRSFNALAADTNHDSSLALPIAPYNGMGINFQQMYGGAPPFDRDNDDNHILIHGYFTYSKQVHNLVIRIAYAPTNYFQKYAFAGGMFTLSSSDTTHLELQFDASEWFEHVGLKQALDFRQLWFSYNGDLVIDNISPYPAFYGIGKSIAADFLTSGKLVVY